jgi:AraC-like DNA-binding protein
LKYLSVESDARIISDKSHHHNGFEIHIVENGHQTYMVSGKTYHVDQGEALLIPPRVAHRVLESAPAASKFSITFEIEGRSLAETVTHERLFLVDARVKDTLAHVAAERERRLSLSLPLVEMGVFEIVVRILRACGMKEEAVAQDQGQDLRYLLAVQYIKDNIETALRVVDVARYCYLSSKQLTRIFLAETGMAVAEYIRRERCYHIEQLLADPTLSLGEISERMNFGNEYYFHTFFKRYAGMSPGAYRGSVLQS